ncbi:hypothetical protein HPA12_00395 [Streptococcus suis]|nr:hypothetical protein [Streptococcus suis]
MIKKCQESKGYGSIRKGIHGAVGVLALGLLFSTTGVVYADDVSENTSTTASSEQDINTSETVELTEGNDAVTSTKTEIVGNEGIPEVETTTATNSPTVEAVPSTDVEGSNANGESISTTPESNTNLEANISSTSSSATDRAAEVLEDRTAPKLVSYTLDKTEYQAGETVTLTIDSDDESNLSNVSSKLISSDGTQSLYFSSSNFEKLANGLYRSVLTGSIPENRPSDVYYIEYIYLGDEIGNIVNYYDSSKNTWAEHTFAPLSMTVNSVTSGSVLIHYQLEDGTTIAEDKRISGVVSELAFGSEEPAATGITYDTSGEAPLLLNGLDGRQYYKVKVDGVEQGLLKAGLTEIIYTYTPYLVSTEQVEKKTGKVIVQYQTRTGQTLKESVEAVPETLISYREKTIYADGSESLSEPIQNYPTFYVYDYQVQTIEQNGKIYRLSYKNQPSLYGELVEGDTVLTLQYIPVPKLESLTFDKESYQPGDNLTASFVVSSEEEMERIFFGLSDKKLTSQYVLRGESYNPIKLGDGLYRFDVTVPIASDYPRSDLSLDFVYLNAKNESSSNSLSEPEIIQNIASQAIINSPNIVTDFSAPKFIELDTGRNEAKQGETVEVVLLVEDDSNIASVNLGFESESGTLRFGENITNIEQLEGNKKRITLSETIHHSYSPGQYELKYLYLTDIYGNTSYLSTVDSLPAKSIVVNQSTDVENLNPVVETTVVTNIEVVEKSSGQVLIRTNFQGEDHEAMKQLINELISAYEKEHGVTFDLAGAGGTQISSRSVTVGNRTQTEVIRSYQQLVVNTSDTPLPEIEKRLLPVGVIYDNSTIRQALYTIQFKDGESTVKESRRVANSTIDSIIRDESNGIDEKAYYFESVEVSQGFTSIFSSDLNYNGPFYEIIVNLKSNSKVENSGSITPPIEVVPPVTDTSTSPTEQESPVSEPPTSPTEQESPVSEPPTVATEQEPPVVEPPTSPTEQEPPVVEPPTVATEQEPPVVEPPTSPTEQEPPVVEPPTSPTEQEPPVVEPPTFPTEQEPPVVEPPTSPTEQEPPVVEPPTSPIDLELPVTEISTLLTNEVEIETKLEEVQLLNNQLANSKKDSIQTVNSVHEIKVEIEKASVSTLPRTSDSQSIFPMLTGLTLLGLTVKVRRKLYK